MKETTLKIPTIDMVGTGANILRLREKKGISVRKLQEYLEFSTPQAIYKWQNGISMPSLDHLLVLSTLFGVSIDDILVKDYHFEIKISA